MNIDVAGLVVKKTKSTKSSVRPNQAKTRAELRNDLKARGVKNIPKNANKSQLIRKLSAAKARETKQRKQEAHEKRSIASRKGWATRLQKTPELRKWETERRKVQRAQLKLLEQAQQAKPKWPRAFRWYNGVYFPVSDMTTEQLYAFMLQLKKRGVRTLRFEREVTVGEYNKDLRGRSSSGFVSSKHHYLSRYNDSELLNGNSRYALPSLQSMRVPGIDFIRFVTIPDSELQYFPKALGKTIQKLPRETRDTISSADEQAFYLSQGKRPSNRKELRAELAAINDRIEAFNNQSADDGDEESDDDGDD